jgi:hypothetical protein
MCLAASNKSASSSELLAANPRAWLNEAGSAAMWCSLASKQSACSAEPIGVAAGFNSALESSGMPPDSAAPALDACMLLLPWLFFVYFGKAYSVWPEATSPLLLCAGKR